MNSTNNVRPITEPRIAPDLTGLGTEIDPLNVINCERLQRKLAIQSNRLLSILRFFNLFSKIGCSTLSKA